VCRIVGEGNVGAPAGVARSHIERGVAHFRGRSDEAVGEETRVAWIRCGHGLRCPAVPRLITASVGGGEQIRHSMTQQATQINAGKRRPSVRTEPTQQACGGGDEGSFP